MPFVIALCQSCKEKHAVCEGWPWSSTCVCQSAGELQDSFVVISQRRQRCNAEENDKKTNTRNVHNVALILSLSTTCSLQVAEG